jgi:hypothetical protein
MLSCGRAERYKGFDDLISALSILRREGRPGEAPCPRGLNGLAFQAFLGTALPGSIYLDGHLAATVNGDYACRAPREGLRHTAAWPRRFTPGFVQNLVSSVSSELVSRSRPYQSDRLLMSADAPKSV